MPTWATGVRPPVVASASTRTIIKVQVPSANNTVTPQTTEGSPVFTPRVPNAGTTMIDLPSGLTPLRGVEIAKPPKASLPQVERPESEPHLGYDLQSFGPFGLKWMKDCQAQDEVFSNQQAVCDAEIGLGRRLQRLDHMSDDHFPSNVQRFGFTLVSIAHRSETEKTNKRLPNPCWRGTNRDSCALCRSHAPSFVYTHPSLICENDRSATVLLSRFRNETENEVKIYQCLGCQVDFLAGCSFSNGHVRLRLEPNGTVKIVYQPVAKGPVFVRDISETNVGLRNESWSVNSATNDGTLAGQRKRRMSRLGESSADALADPQERIENVDQVRKGKEKMVDNEDPSSNSLEDMGDPENEVIPDKRKRSRSPTGRRSGRLAEKKTMRSGAAADNRTTAPSQARAFPRPLTPASSSGSSGFFEMVDKAPAGTDAQGLKGTNQLSHDTTPASSKPGARTVKHLTTRPTGFPSPRNEAARVMQSSSSAGGTATSLEDIHRKCREMEEKIEALKKLEKTKAVLEGLEQRLL